MEKIRAYLDEVSGLMASLPVEQLDGFVGRLMEAYDEGRQLFLLGNGGSAATASHLLADFQKCIYMAGGKTFRSLAVTDSIPLITAGETATRNVLDLSAVSVVHAVSHLPIVVDPSHATGRAAYVRDLAVAAAAIGADGLLIEVHPDPATALSNGPQSITPSAFAELMRDVRATRAAVPRAEAPRPMAMEAAAT